MAEEVFRCEHGKVVSSGLVHCSASPEETGISVTSKAKDDGLLITTVERCKGKCPKRKGQGG